MIAMLIRNSWKQLRRDRGAQVLAFVVPIAFFSIFAVIFGPRGSSVTGTSRVAVAVADESNTPRSRALVAAMAADSGLKVLTVWTGHAEGGAKSGQAITRALAERLVKDGDVETALVLPAGIDTSMLSFARGGVKALVLRDPSDPVASKVVGGLLQRAALHAGGGGLLALAGGDPDAMLPIRVEERAVLGERRESPMIAFYAAGIAVMFIMFSAASAGGALIEETESGTLERVLTTGLGMNGLLAAKWIYLTSLGCMQICVMFVWGMLVFRLPLLGHLPGFAIMTVCTAAAAAAFGLVLATLSRTRQQLSGLANLLVLSLNALGGSMFPRFLMSEALQKYSLVGFNAWALDGYLKVFWRESPLAALAPQVGALLGFTALFLVLARRLARRWEAA
ncbi:MAG TPA: ABC transporter permease [Candidatus Eisenbacteria bacterium]|jgi:ABC-2 type transport system permease protein